MEKFFFLSFSKLADSASPVLVPEMYSKGNTAVICYYKCNTH